MHDPTTQILALQHARDWSDNADEIAMLTDEIDKLIAERRTHARAVPGFATRATDH